MWKNMRKEQKEAFRGWLFIAPALIYMAVIVGYSMLYNFDLGFRNVTIKNINGEKLFVWFENYINIMKTENMHWAIRNTFKFTLISISFQFILGLSLALLFSKKIRGLQSIRGALVISYLMPNVVTALLFKYMLSPDAGIIDKLLMAAGIIDGPVGWIQNTETALWGPIFANVWAQTPFIMLLLSTGLANISQDIIESSALDGANGLQRFFYITLPLLKNSIFAVMMIGFMYTFKVFDLIWTMTGGGPVYATEVLSTYAYKLSFSSFNFSQGAACANILFLCLLCVSMFYRHLIGKEDD